MTATAGPSTPYRPTQPSYCGVCTLPTEYCEFGPSVSKCKAWLEGKDKGEFERLWGEGECCAVSRLVSSALYSGCASFTMVWAGGMKQIIVNDGKDGSIFPLGATSTDQYLSPNPSQPSRVSAH